MARAKLNKNARYGTIFGIHEYGAVFEQGGKLFNGAGDEVGPGITEEVAEPLRQGAAGPAITAPVTDGGDADKEPGPEVPLAERLKELHPAQLAKLVTEAGLKPATGAGSKARNIDLLVAAVE